MEAGVAVSSGMTGRSGSKLGQRDLRGIVVGEEGSSC